ncbi:uncharacterized protein BX664DRAFT_266866 [Halteromyces radiatus]|uniref:uncharacterized protein n=1 Tax=Halteromyces radiatus TaxID=101107 RepID=UPI00221E54C8|nr:uncharacterized protein BX664DRAFT_266866 [Halteromyces radiatus]KAI8084845.1 hypothetical protein BX664DRAFT_266866 [Halteromyces radiatus]
MVGNSTIRKFPFEFCRGIFACKDSPGLPTYNAKQPTGLLLQLVLCSSVGFLCFVLFCYLRVRWPSMYAPRLNMKKHAPKQLSSSFFGWILPVLKTPNSEVLEKVGLDAVVMLQFLLMAAKLFALCGFFGTVVLYPISRMGGDLLNSTDPSNNHTDTNSTSFLYYDLATPTAPETSNSFLWIYLFFTYFFCLATFYFTFLNYRDYVRIRQEFMLRIGRTIPSRTVLVSGIPPALRSDQALADYFEKLGIGVVDSVHIIRHVSRLLDFIKERALCLRQLETAYARFWGNPCNDPAYDPDFLLSEAEQDQRLNALNCIFTKLKNKVKEPTRPLAKDGFLGVVGKHVDAIEYYTERFNELDATVIKARRYGKFLPTSVGFVTFEDTMSASIASQVLIDSTPFRLKAQLAPEPRDVLWENIAMHGRERWIRKVLMFGVLLLLVFFWVIPISYFSALTNENSLRYYFPWLMDLASKNKILQQIIQSFLPTLGVVIFMAILPMILNALSVVEGFPTRSEAEESTFSKYFFFLLFNVLLVFTASSALFKTLREILEDPSQIANILATKLPQVAPFFVNYTVIHGMMLLPIQLLQIGPVITQTFHRTFISKTPRDYAEVLAPRMYNYGWGYPMPVFLFVVLLVYSTITPLILVFGTFYYCMSYLVVKYQLLYVYFHPYEVAGRMWPLVFSRIIVGLLLFETLAAGLFVLNKAYTLALLCTPLVFLTLLFNFGMDRAYQKSTQYLPLQSAPVTPKPQEQQQQQLITMNNGSNANLVNLRRRRTVLDEDDYEAETRKYTNFKEPPMTLLNGILNTGMKKYAHPAFLGVLPQLWLPIKARPRHQRRQQQYSNNTEQTEQQPLIADDSGNIQPTGDHNDDDQPTHATNGVIVSTSSSNNIYQSLPSPSSSPQQQQQQQQQPDSSENDRADSAPILTTTSNSMVTGQERDTTELSTDIPSDEEDSMEDEVDTNNGTYYHHPERKVSKTLLSRSYGATG